MKKILLTLLTAGVLVSAQAQKNEAVRRAAQAPDRAAQSARADLFVQDKSVVTPEPSPVKNQKPSAKKPRKKSCGKCCKKA